MNDTLELIQNIINQRAMFANVTPFYTGFKRIADIVISLIAIIICIPLFIVLAILIKLTSEGPVLFIQERNGYKGRVFKMLKFRSMINGAERYLKDINSLNEISGHMFKIKNDPRMTAIGKFIRRTSLDELPQLYNILKGDMSIVGPRPPIPREVNGYDPWHNLRLSVKPGLTGLWQVSGRNSLGFDEMVRLDLKYIKERSLLLDMRIFFKTIPVLFGDHRAY